MSFGSEGEQSHTSADEWEISRSRSLFIPFGPWYSATKDDRTIDIGFIWTKMGKILRSNSISMDRFGDLNYNIFMTINDEPIRFVLKPNRESYGYEVIPEVGTIKMVGTKLEINIFGVGCANHRSAWRDEHFKENILGFVSVSCENQKNEESLVWLVGSLGTQGMGQFGSNPA